MFRKLQLSLLALFLLPLSVFAQEVSISGVVTDANNGDPLPGTNVIVVELQKGAATNIDGEYTINNVPSGTYTLRANFVGYQRFQTTIEVGTSDVVLDIELSLDVVGLEDVVVTAQGIQREKRALGYAVSTVNSDQVAGEGDSDITRALKGSVPGVNITQTSGVSGTATDIVIRGYNTLTGSNQPLFIVDGVQFNANTNATSSFVDGGALSTSSRFLDIDPNNIESISVLKGLSATTIYGEQGRNGVVLITTKNGSFSEDQEPGFDITFDQSLFTNQIASAPDYQDTYGGGFHQNFGFFFSNWGPSFDSDLSDNSLFIREENGVNILEHPYAQFSSGDLIAAFPQFQPGGAQHEYAYRAYDDPSEFFEDGTVSQTSINISGGTQDVNLNLNVGYTDDDGFTPNNTLKKTNVGLGLNSKVNERFTVRATGNIALTDLKTPPIASSFGSSASGASGGSIFGDVFYTPRSVDLLNLPFQNPVTGGSVYYRSGNDIENPRWVAENIFNTDEVDRFFGKVEANYEILENLNVLWKLGLDSYSELQSFGLNRGGVNNPDLTGGYYQTTNINQTIWDNNLQVNYATQLNEQFSLDALAGAQIVLDKFERDGIGSQNQIIFDLFEHGNFTDPSSSNFFSGADFQFRQTTETAGVFFQTQLGYNDYLYLTLSGRNDWFSTLEEDNRSIFYPSASVSFIPTDFFEFDTDMLNYLKIRAGVGTSAGAPNPFGTRNVLSVNARSFIDTDGAVVTTNAVSNQLGNLDLEPELQTEFEVGIESRLINNRVGLDVSYYFRTTEDLITNANLDPSTGFTGTLVNIGEVENQGLEIALNATPFSGNFTWNSTLNFFTDASEVTDLGNDLDEIALSGFTNLGNFAIEGEPLNIIQGSRILRNEDGRRIIDENGDFVQDGEIGIIGNPTPKYTLSSINDFNYRNFTLNVQVDYQQGGDVYSTYIATLLARGITTDTDFDRQVPVILPGVVENPDGSFRENDIQISSTQAYFTNIGFGPDEVSVFDATHIRLSEVSLSYNLPVTVIQNTPLKQVTLTASGFNLAYFAFNAPEGTNWDPNVSGTGADNGRGFDFLAGPSSRRIGGSIRIRF